MGLTVRRENMTLEYQGCTVTYVPRNMEMIGKLRDKDGEQKSALEVAELLIVGIDGLTDDSTGEVVEFSNDVLKYLDPDDLAGISQAISDSYGLEQEQEKN